MSLGERVGEARVLLAAAALRRHVAEVPRALGDRTWERALLEEAAARFARRESSYDAELDLG